MLQTLNFYGSRQADAKADFFRYESCSSNGADESIRVKADGNDLGLFLPGDYVNLPVFATRWEVAPVTTAAAGTFRLGIGRVGSARLTGIVSVVDANRNDVLSGKAYAISASVGGTAGTFAGVAVWNPAGSGRVANVTEILASAIAATSLTLGSVSVAPSAIDTLTSNKKLGSPVATIMRGYQEYPSASPASFSRIFYWLSATSISKVFGRPILVMPGQGLVLINNTAAQATTVNFEITEELL